MNFFERQATVRRQSRLLVVYFAIAVVGIVLALNLVAQLVLTFTADNTTDLQDGMRETVAVLVTVGAVLLIGCSSWYRIWVLRRGGGAKVAVSLGGTRVSPDTTDPHLRRLHNVVEELAIAATLPVPDVYVLHDETGLNAFAAGHSPADAAVAVTAGTLERLNRAELEGVIGHELSHITNGDMRLNMRLMGTVHGIEAMAVTGRMMLTFGRGGRRHGRRRYVGAAYVGSRASGRRGNGKGNGAVAVILLAGLAMMVVGYIGVFMGRLIKAAVSRQREYLADASAVQFTRQTEGLAGALKKIGGLTEGSHLESGKVDEVSHMLFGDGLELSSAFATHPPIVERIRALDPAFDAQTLGALAQQWQQNPPSGLAEDRAMGLAEPGVDPATSLDAPSLVGGPAAQPPATTPPPVPETATAAPDTLSPLPDQPVPVDPAQLAARTGVVDDNAHGWARNLLAAAPRDLVDRAHDPAASLPLVLGLVMAVDPDTNTRQHRIVGERLGPATADAAWNEAGRLAHLEPTYRLPLAEIAFPALRHRDRTELETTIGLLHALIWVDGQLSPHEYFLARLIARQLELALSHAEPASSPSQNLRSRPGEVAMLLSAMAQIGHRSPDRADRAYAHGYQHLGVDQVPPRPTGIEHIVSLDQIWPGLDRLWWPERSRLIESLVTVAAHDGVMTVSEIELLRLVCAMLSCPLPAQFLPS